MARHFLKTFEASERIVVPSGSCTAMVTHHFADLFQKEPETLARVHAMEKKVYEFATFLTDVAGVEDVGARMEDVVTFHDGCHALRELGIKSAPRRLLARVKGLELREMVPAEECCGFGGTFSVKFAELSGAMARTKIEAIVGTGAQHRGVAGSELPDADSGRSFARGLERAHHAPGRSPGEPLTPCLSNSIGRFMTRWPTPICNWPSTRPPAASRKSASR